MQIFAIIQSLGGRRAAFPSVVSPLGNFEIPVAGAVLPETGTFLVRGVITLIGGTAFLVPANIADAGGSSPFAHCSGTVAGGILGGSGFRTTLHDGQYSGVLAGVWCDVATIVPAIAASGGFPAGESAKATTSSAAGGAAGHKPILAVEPTAQAPIKVPSVAPTPCAPIVVVPPAVIPAVVVPAVAVLPESQAPQASVTSEKPAAPMASAPLVQNDLPGLVVLTKKSSKPFPFAKEPLPGLVPVAKPLSKAAKIAQARKVAAAATAIEPTKKPEIKKNSNSASIATTTTRAIIEESDIETY